MNLEETYEFLKKELEEISRVVKAQIYRFELNWYMIGKDNLKYQFEVEEKLVKYARE